MDDSHCHNLLTVSPLQHQLIVKQSETCPGCSERIKSAEDKQGKGAVKHKGKKVTVLSDDHRVQEETSVLHISARLLWENTLVFQLQTITA